MFIVLCEFRTHTKILIKLLESLFVYELQCIPTIQSEETSGWHTHEKSGLTSCFQGACIIPSCNSRPKNFCLRCTRDVPGIVFVCKPGDGKHCWDILHQVCSSNPMDAQGNQINPSNLIKKRRRNSNLGGERVPKRLKEPLIMNPHHVQQNG